MQEEPSIEKISEMLNGTDENSEVKTKKIDIRKSYLNTRISDGDSEKKMNIRILPCSANTDLPFEKVHVHVIRVNKEVKESGFKEIICAAKNNFEKNCPLCSLSYEAYKKTKEEGMSPSETKKYKDIQKENSSRIKWIAKVIDRDNEEDGVKFWSFFDNYNKDGIKDKINSIFESRKEDGINIFSKDDGKDLRLTITRKSDGKTSIQISDASKTSPLSSDPEKMKEWMEDDKKWSDYFTVKPSEYVTLLACGKVPYFDKESGKYVDKEVLFEERKRKKEEMEASEKMTDKKYDAKTTEEEAVDLPF